MSVYVGIVTTGPSTSLTLDVNSLVERIAKLLRRKDINSEIMLWLDFSLKEFADRVDFPELREGVTTDLISSPVTYEYALPADFSHADSVYYRHMSGSDTLWGRHLIPLPRKFYQGDTVDLERLLHTLSPSVGDPQYFWIAKKKLGIYPALSSEITGKVDLYYYRIPEDLVLGTQEPAIDKKWRHYLIWLGYYWGKVFLEAGVPERVAMWRKIFYDTIDSVGGFVRKQENVVERVEKPDVGLENADEIY